MAADHDPMVSIPTRWYENGTNMLNFQGTWLTAIIDWMALSPPTIYGQGHESMNLYNTGCTLINLLS
jgi:hypothetical protein